MYRTLFETIALYACPAWTLEAKSRHWAELEKAQRSALLMVTQAYRTTSTDALQILAGQLPIDLRLRAMSSKWLVAHDQPSQIPGQETEEQIDEWSLDNWQERWTNSRKGRHTHRIWPDVRVRLSQQHVEVDHYLAQVATGHGDFKAKLYSFNLVPAPNCRCQAEETVDHVVLNCPQFDGPRRRWQAVINEADEESWKAAFATRRHFEATRTFTHKVFQMKDWPIRPAKQPAPGSTHTTSARSIPGTASNGSG